MDFGFLFGSTGMFLGGAEGFVSFGFMVFELSAALFLFLVLVVLVLLSS